MHLESSRSKWPVSRGFAMLPPPPVCPEIFPNVVMFLTTVSTCDLWFVLASCLWIYQGKNRSICDSAETGLSTRVYRGMPPP